MRYTPIIGTLGFVLSADKKSTLLVHRITNKSDDQYGKYNGLGGKMHQTEDVFTCIKREIFEEAGIECTKTTLRGTMNWTGFGPKKENWLGFIFLIEEYSGKLHTVSPEGPLEWVALEELPSLPMCDGDRFFLPLVFDKDPRLFHGYLPLEGDNSKGWSYSRIG